MAAKKMLILVAGIFSIMYLPNLLQFGIFFDGLTYAALSRNLAYGLGDFWSPFYTETIYSKFYEHPALGLWLQSLVYQMLGDDPLWDRLYGLLASLAVVFLIMKLWQHQPEEEKRCGVWWPVLLWLSILWNHWTFTNNMLETSLTVATTLSVYWIVLACTSVERSKQCFWLFCGALAINAGFLIKGPVSLFPLATPFFVFYFKGGSWRTILKWSIALGLFTAIPLVLLFLYYPPAHEFFQIYWNNQVTASISGERERASSRFALLIRLFSELALPIGLIILLMLITRAKRVLQLSRWGRIWLAVGMSASLPLLLSPKQMSWYLIPSFVFYALFLGSITQSLAAKIESFIQRNYRWSLIMVITGSCMFLAGSILMAYQKGTSSSKSPLYSDLLPENIMDTNLPSRIHVCPGELKQRWSLVAFMQRFHRVSLDNFDELSIVLVDVNAPECRVFEGCDSLQYKAGKQYHLCINP